MILHTINKSPLRDHSLTACLEFLAKDDAILLLEDGVYGATSDTADRLVHTAVFAIQADLKARGLLARVAPHVTVVDYDGFVKLCIDYPVIKHWP